MSVEIPDPKTAPELYDGVLTRRVVAYFIDLAVLSVISVGVILISLIAGIPTFGLAWLLAPVSLFVAVVLYYASTLGSPRRATIGMAMMDLVLTPTRGLPLEGWRAFAHPLLFWITIWVAWPLLLLGLFTSRRQLIHDLVLGTLMLRRSPMEAHWAHYQAA